MRWGGGARHVLVALLAVWALTPRPALRGEEPVPQETPAATPPAIPEDEGMPVLEVTEESIRAEAQKESAARPADAAAGVVERRRELQELRKRLSGLKARYAATRKKEADLTEALEAAELNLQIQTAERRVLELKRQEVAREAAGSIADRDEAARLVASYRSDLGVRMSALYRLGRLGYLRTLVAADSGPSFLHGVRVLAHLARRDAALLKRYEAALASLEAREKDLGARRKELGALAIEARRKESALAAARAQKAALLASVRKSSEVERVQVTTLEDKSERLAALLELLEGRGRALAPGASSIRTYRGALDWPLKGSVAVPFGRIANPKFPKTFLRSSGWTLEAPPGTSVHAVFSGEVVYAQWLKGYGNLVVVDHADGVFTLYGRLAPGTVGRGERVSIGDRIGVLGETPEDEVAGLMFEIRENRASVDPAGWLR
jgi:murein hydrolase activator